MSSASDVLKLILLVSNIDASSKCCKKDGTVLDTGDRIYGLLTWAYIAVMSMGKYHLLLSKFWPVDNDTTYFMSNRSVAAYL